MKDILSKVSSQLQETLENGQKKRKDKGAFLLIIKLFINILGYIPD